MKHISEYLEEGLREMFEERSAVMHFDGGIPKEKAEALAMAEVETYQKHRADCRKEWAKRRDEIVEVK